MTYLRRHLDEQLDRFMSVASRRVAGGDPGVRGRRPQPPDRPGRWSVWMIPSRRPPSGMTRRPYWPAPKRRCSSTSGSECPKYGDVVRLMVDEDRSPGRFILSGFGTNCCLRAHPYGSGPLPPSPTTTHDTLGAPGRCPGHLSSQSGRARDRLDARVGVAVHARRAASRRRYLGAARLSASGRSRSPGDTSQLFRSVRFA